MMTENLPTLPDDAAARIERDLFTRLGVNSKRRARKHRLVAGGVVALLGGLSVAAVALASDVLQDRSAYCYATTDTNARYTQVGSPTDSDNSTSNAAPSDPVAAAIDNCAAIWQIGFFEAETPPVDGADQFPVPDLVACIRPDQVPAVFPSDPNSNGSDAGFCRGLGLTAP